MNGLTAATAPLSLAIVNISSVVESLVTFVSQDTNAIHGVIAELEYND